MMNDQSIRLQKKHRLFFFFVQIMLLELSTNLNHHKGKYKVLFHSTAHWLLFVTRGDELQDKL